MTVENPNLWVYIRLDLKLQRFYFSNSVGLMNLYVQQVFWMRLMLVIQDPWTPFKEEMLYRFVHGNNSHIWKWYNLLRHLWLLISSSCAIFSGAGRIKTNSDDETVFKIQPIPGFLSQMVKQGLQYISKFLYMIIMPSKLYTKINLK